MNPSFFLIVADRGTLKAYTVDGSNPRGPSPQLTEAFSLTDAHGRFGDKFTDQAGAFPNGGTAGQGNSAAERPHLRAEQETRVLRQLTRHVTDVLEKHQPFRWHFAAPAEINGAILDGVPAALKSKLDQNVKHDLTHTPPGELLRHFERKEK